jgi:5,5'-dehydrodivanillate O-demethylase
MLSKEDNAKLTQVGPGTPMGDLLRRYWHPIAAAQTLEAEMVLQLRILGENLALFRTYNGKLGLVQERCPHRSASLAFGIPDEDGLRCPYHGWKFNAEGECVSMPYDDTENPDNAFKSKITVMSYPVQELGGLIWAYMGPAPAPVLPQLGRYTNAGFNRVIDLTPLPCNYLQIMENSMDPSHFEWLHANRINFTARKRGKPEPMVPGRTLALAFDEFEYGIYKRRIIEGDPPETSPDWLIGHPVLFPTTLALPWGFQLRTPIDDENTLHILYNVREPAPGEQPSTVVKSTPWCDENKQFILDTVIGTDELAWITPGAVSPRYEEHLGLLDRGIIAYRNMLFDNMAKLERGIDPLGVIRNQEDAMYTYGTEGDLGGGWRGFHAPNRGAGNNETPQVIATPAGGGS